jgi:GDPmannose 4,6-dehydratase
MKPKSALITGITGMDGKLLADLLISKGYKIYGLYRENLEKNLTKVEEVTYIKSDLSSLDPLDELFSGFSFDEIYNLGGQTFINPSWEDPEYTLKVNCLSVIKFLTYIKDHSPKTKFFNASSSEVFAGATESPQKENTQYAPKNPYGSSKILANNVIKNYRENYGIFACSGILYTHEGVERNEYYVSKKITNGVVKIHLGLSDSIILGDIDSSRDWLSAKDAVNAMWMIMQENIPDDFIISSGISRTIGDFLSCSFSTIQISNWEKYIKIDSSLTRSKQEVKIVGDNSKLVSIGWKPEFTFENMISELVSYGIEKFKINE